MDSSTSPQTVYLYELTVCFEREVNIEAANRKKYNSYCGLATDIEDNGYKCKNFPNEVGFKGSFDPRQKIKTVHTSQIVQTKHSVFQILPEYFQN